MTSALLTHTQKGGLKPAKLALESGLVFEGVSCGAQGEAFGEVCFNTSLEGYLEVISDPSYAGQIVTMTYPQIGNYGVSYDDLQSDVLALRGLVVRDMCFTPSNWRSDVSLPDFLVHQGVVAIAGIDTRMLVAHIRDKGAQRAVVSTIDLDSASLLEKARTSDSIVGQNLAQTVSCTAAHGFDNLPQGHAFALDDHLAQTQRYNVVVYDCGVKKSILHGLLRAGCKLTVVPWDTPAEQVLSYNPNGVFLSNGPGDPQAVTHTYEQVKQLLGKVPLFGICLGHQMMALASGARMEKLAYGHHGGNQPVMNLRTHRVEITAQNHGFGLLFDSLGSLVPEESAGFTSHKHDLRFWAEQGVAPVVNNEVFGRIQLTHVNLNDGTAEGMAFLDVPAFSVQYHPEANPGPTDAHYLFTAFTQLMEGNSAYLDIDIAKDRLAGWVFGAPKGGVHA